MPPRTPSLLLLLLLLAGAHARAQSLALPWSGHGHDAQHTGISRTPAQPLQQIRWQMPVDLQPVYWGTSLLIHYGTPLITRANTVLVPVKTGANDGFRIEARDGHDGSVKWILPTDYSPPASNWTPPCGIALSPNERLFFPGAGGTICYRDAPDQAAGPTGQMAFFGAPLYREHAATFDAAVKINTPITVDRYGNIFFGFIVLQSNPAGLRSGLARLSEDGGGSWVAADELAGDAAFIRLQQNAAPALSNDHKTLYVVVSTGDNGAGYLVALDSRTLAPLSRVRMRDALHPENDIALPDVGSASPTVGPDGDVYFGVLEQPYYANNLRGWMLHYDSTLTQTRIAGAFGWDDTASIIPATMVPSYHGSSAYLILTKYNNYVGTGGDGVNRLAILDPHDSMLDPISGATVMKEILTIAGPTPDWEYPNIPGAVREWCINTAAVDPATRSVLVNCEDGLCYRWNLATNSFTESIRLTNGLGQAYTPTAVGVDGTVYAIANATLFALGRATP